MMKKYVFVGAGTVAALFFLLYISKTGPFAADGTQAHTSAGSGTAQAHQHKGAPVGPQPALAATAAPQESRPIAETGAGAPTVEIPTDKQRLIGVRTATAVVQPLVKTIRTVGVVEYDQRRLNTINTKVEGWIERLYVNFTGMYVKKGDPVADIYSPELWATQQEFIAVVKWAKRSRARAGSATPKAPDEAGLDVAALIDRDAQSLVDAARQRLRLWDISDTQIKKIEESENPIRTLTVYSPYSGSVLQKSVNQGQKIMPGDKLLDLADLSTVWITADIYEYELPLVKVGDRATIQLSYLPGKHFSTLIDYINPVLEGETRTAKARFVIPNEGGLIKPQMFTNVEMTINLGRSLVVPNDAVIDTGVRKIAYVDKGDGNFEPREVVTGTQTDKMVEIKAGLRAGEKVASSANFLIDSEAKLKGVEALPRTAQKPNK